MKHLQKVKLSALALVLGAGCAFSVAAAAPASAMPQCASNANLWHVHRRIEGAIDQLSHDQSDYGGHKAAALNDLTTARGELVAAEQYAVQRYNDSPACFQAHGPVGGSAFAWGTRGQGGSNRDIWGVRRWVAGLIGQLNRDNRDYGGHKAAAINALQAARGEMLAAEQYAQGHGY